MCISVFGKSISAQAAVVRNAPTLAQALFNVLSIHGDKPLLGRSSDDVTGSGSVLAAPIAVGGFSFTPYSTVLAASTRTALALRHQLGLPPDAAVALCGDNTPEWLVADFACVFNGFLTVGVHTGWAADKLTFVLNDACVACAVVGASSFSTVLQLARAAAVPTLRHVVLLGTQAEVERLVGAAGDVGAASHVGVFSLEALCGFHGEGRLPHMGDLASPMADGRVDGALVTDGSVTAGYAVASPELRPYALMYTSGTTGTAERDCAAGSGARGMEKVTFVVGSLGETHTRRG